MRFYGKYNINEGDVSKMFKLLNKKKNNKGFTLVELVIVIAILAILVGLLAPQYTKYVEKSRKTADASNMDEIVKVIKVFAADPDNDLPTNTYKVTISNTKRRCVRSNYSRCNSKPRRWHICRIWPRGF